MTIPILTESSEHRFIEAFAACNRETAGWADMPALVNSLPNSKGGTKSSPIRLYKT